MNKRNTIKSTLLIFIFCCIAFMGFSQKNPADTFEVKISALKTDTARLREAITISKYFENIDSATAWKYFNIAKELANKLNTVKSGISILELEGVLNTKANPGKAYTLYKQAIEICRNNAADTTLRELQASLLNNLGVISYLNGDYEDAANSFLESVKMYEQYYPHHSNLVPTLGNVATTYAQLGYIDKATLYSRRVLEYAIKDGQPKQEATAYINLGGNLISDGKADSGYAMIQKAESLTNITKNQYDLYLCNWNFASYHSQKNNLDSALYYYQKCLTLAKAINSPYDIANTLNNIANQQMDKRINQVQAAKKNLDSSFALIQQYNFREMKRQWLLLMSAYYRAENNADKCFEYTQMSDSLKDSLYSEGSLLRTGFIEARYQSEKQQNTINQLQKEKEVDELSVQQKTILNYSLIGGLIAILVIGTLLYLNFKRKQQLSKQTTQLQSQRIKELEQEKQLVAMDSLLKGQEEERSRMAKDLHDGLGGLLSGVKFSLSSMKGNVILSGENVHVFNSALGQLDNAMNEMRRVAHNMMPEALMKFGLVQALQDFCDHVNETKNIHINLQTFGLEERMDEPTEIVVYRIVQELLNNILKHADAKTVLLQLLQQDGQLSITVEDDGKGFDTKTLATNKGAGMLNIQSRIDYLKGTMEIESSPGKGTSVHIHCTLNKA